MKKKNEIIVSNMLLLLMVLFPILSQYQFKNGISFELTIVLLLNFLLTIELIICKTKLRIESFIVVMALIVPISFLSIYKFQNSSTAVNNILAMLMFIFTIYMVTNDQLIDSRKYFKILYVLGVFATFFLIYQSVSFHVFDRIVYG